MASRNYSQATLKILFALSGNQCAEPDCIQPIIASKTPYSDAKVIGQIAHIYAHSDGGPRSKPNLTEKERKSLENLLVLCPNHHSLIDKQHETYPAILLLKWKAAHEKKIQGQIENSISNLDHPELEKAAKDLMISGDAPPDHNTNIVPPKRKMKKNNLGSGTALFLTMGASKSAAVEQILNNNALLDAKFPERLKGGFTLQYNKLRSQGVTGDELFLEMWMWASGDSNEESRKLAGLCILTHLFIICDVFEK